MQPMWKKLQYSNPYYARLRYSLGYRGNVIGFRLGSLYGNGNGVPALITSLTYNITDDKSWDISILVKKSYWGNTKNDRHYRFDFTTRVLLQKDTTIYSRDWFKTQTALIQKLQHHRRHREI